jgi:hypothetical protein
MQKLTIISGLPHEGKTKELFDSYKKHFLGVTIFAPGDTKLNRLIAKPVFITATNENPIKDYILVLEGFDVLGDNEKSFMEESHKFYNKVKERGELFNIMTSNIREGDCIFYIDNMLDVVTIDELLTFMNSFPSDITTNSCDIVVTKRRCGITKFNTDTIFIKVDKNKELYITPIVQHNPILYKLTNSIESIRGTALYELLVRMGYDETINTNLVFTRSAIDKIMSDIKEESIMFDAI